MDIIGKSTIHPVLFYTGKIAGYITWILLILAAAGMPVLDNSPSTLQIISSGITSLIAMLLITTSAIGLGKSTRLGLPKEDTVLKTTGIYRFSRNPMYLGFNLLTLTSMIYFFNFLILGLGLYSIIIYHFIILGEERFLKKRFGEDFAKYRKSTGRYF